ncbi:hypothetical protein L5515_000357 [Caenorhabditis briggsae]|uniref:Uncharacterized protein n=1 Tax=Caenorhabditis briggsae TaxID=6238 RepID=A0AAE9J1M0_CAEBR|nr:hypothetical protein L5515_000357 [Caenorhabditis briggsae]
MQKNNQSKKPSSKNLSPGGASGRPKKEKPSKDTKKSKNLVTGKRTPSNTKVKTLTTSVSSTDAGGGGTRTAEEAKSADTKPKKEMTRKRSVTPAPREKELKLEPTQQDEPEKKEEPAGVQSGMDIIVKDDKKIVKMDDGYEDFGPGAA